MDTRLLVPSGIWPRSTTRHFPHIAVEADSLRGKFLMSFDDHTEIRDRLPRTAFRSG